MKQKEKKLAERLRKQGHSLNHIAKVVGVSKSTASIWCRDVEMPPLAKKELQKKTRKSSLEGLARYAVRKKKMRTEAIARAEQAGQETLGMLSRRDIYCLGLGLYWGEGYKRGSQEFGFTNSDPKMIVFYVHWLKKIFNIPKENLILRVSINGQHAERLDEVEVYWQRLLGVPAKQFTKASLIKTKSKKTYSNAHKHMGTLRVKVRNGTAFRREVLGAIKSI